MIGDDAGAALVVAGFTFLLARLGLVDRARRINGVLRSTAGIVADRAMPDREKERALQRGSLTLFALFAALTAGLAAAVGLPILLVWLIGLTKLWDFEHAMRATLSWPFLIGGLLLFIIVLVANRRSREG
jgi:hypothetical protein